jgi:shikimate dehydrogenase
MTDRYAVIGNPISHSKSPIIHAAFAKQTSQDLTYTAILAPLEGFEDEVRKFQDSGGKGMNVTVPFKQKAWHLANHLSNRAIDAEAVNTLEFLVDGGIRGDNTDGVGLVRDIQDNLAIMLQGKRILLMGAGGAARGVMTPLLEAHPERLVIVNRTLDKAEQIVRHYEQGDRFSQVSISSSTYDLSGNQFDIVINATSASLSDALPPLSAGIFAPGSLAYDMMYGKGLTPFLQFAQAQGAARLADGLGMLVEQAAESCFLWRNVRPDTQPIIQLLKQ